MDDDSLKRTKPHEAVSGHDDIEMADVVGRVRVRRADVPTPFAGRQADLGTLLGHAESAIAGEGQFVPVIGETGAGKNRLLEELRARIGSDRARIIEGRCRPHGSGTPYLPIVAACRRLLGIQVEDPLELQGRTAVRAILSLGDELEPLLPLYLQLLAIPSEEFGLPEKLEGRPFRHAMLDAVAALFSTASRRTPILLLFRDWHWVDEASHAAVRQLASGCSRDPLLVVVGYRPESAPDWGASCDPRPLHLEALGPVSCAAIVRSSFGARRVGEELATTLHEKSLGNPLFLEQLCQYLLDDETRISRPDRLPDLPENLQSILLARVGGLSSPLRDLVERVAVFGGELSCETAEGLLPAPADVEEKLQRLVHAGFLRKLPGSVRARYDFSHSEIRRVVHESLSKKRRRELHKRAGRVLARSPAGSCVERADRLARHFAGAEEWSEAVSHALAAAERAHALSQFPDALLSLEQARGWLARRPRTTEADEQRIAFLQMEAGVSEIAGDRTLQRRAIDELIELLAEKADRPEHVSAYLRQAELFALDKRFDEGEQAIARALAVSRRLENRDLERDALRGLAFLLWQSHRNEEALHVLDRAVEIDRGHTDPHRIIGDLTNRASVLRALGRYDDALESLREALLYCEQPGIDPHRHVETLYVMHTIYRDLGRSEASENYLRRAVAVQDEDRFAVHHPFPTSALANLLLQRGEAEEALVLLHEAVRRCRQSRYAFGLPQCQRKLSEVLTSLGRREEALLHQLEAAESFGRLGEFDHECEMLALAGPTLESLEEYDRARLCWQRITETASDDAIRATGFRGLARIAENQGAPARARYYLRRALSICPMPTSARKAEILNALGILEWKRGHYEDALEHYRHALEVFEYRRDEHHAGLTLNSIGATLKALGRYHEASTVLDRALRLHERCGEKLFAGHALALLGDVALALGRVGAARGHYRASLDLRLEVADRRGEGWMRCRLARTLRDGGDEVGYEEQIARATTIAQELDDGELSEACLRLQASP